MDEYLVKMKNLVDRLKLAGSPISNLDLIIQTMNGLDSEYNPMVVKLVLPNSLLMHQHRVEIKTPAHEENVPNSPVLKMIKPLLLMVQMNI